MTPCAACGGIRPCASPYCLFGAYPDRPPPALLTPEPAEPPRVTGKVLGFRAWELHGYTLCSVAAPGRWGIGVNTAMCKMGAMGRGCMPTAAPGHEAPHPGCHCGLYALHSTQTWAGDRDGFPPHSVFGAILAWGRIEVHGNGFRAQYAEPIILAYHRKQPYDDVIAARTTAEEFNLPFVEISELEARAREFGEPIAPALRPAISTPPPPLRLPPPGRMYASGGMIMLPPGAQVSSEPLPRSRWGWVPAALHGVNALAQVTFWLIWGSLLSVLFALVLVTCSALSLRRYLRKRQ